MPRPVAVRPVRPWIPLVLAVATVVAFVTLPAWAGARTKPEPCPAGRFLVTGGGDLLGGTPAAPVYMEFSGRSARFVGSCPPARSRVRVLRRGTKLQVTFADCGAQKRVRLKAAIATTCDAVSGSLTPQKGGKVAFAAALSRCGDGVVDAGRGETCESGACTTGDGAPGTCVACLCQAGNVQPAVCDTVAVANQGWVHVPVDSVIAYDHNPPASGPHYPIWARYQEHTAAVPRGYWVHDLEHGAVVMLYRPDAGAAVIDALRAAFLSLPADPQCPGLGRALLTPDPLLDKPFSVVAANVELVCDRVDAQQIADFTTMNRGHGPETVCVSGAYPPQP